MVGAISGLVTPCIFELRRQSSSVHSALSWLSTKLQVVQQSLSKKRKNGSDVNITLHLYSCCKPPCLGLCQLFPGLFLGVQDCSLQRKVPNVMFEVSNIYLLQYININGITDVACWAKQPADIEWARIRQETQYQFFWVKSLAFTESSHEAKEFHLLVETAPEKQVKLRWRGSWPYFYPFSTWLLAPQSGALRISAYRDFLPSHPSQSHL